MGVEARDKEKGMGTVVIVVPCPPTRDIDPRTIVDVLLLLLLLCFNVEIRADGA